MLTPPFLPVMTTGKSCFQVIESPCLNFSSQMCTALSLPLPPQPFRLACAVTKRNITFWHTKPKTNGSWSRGIRYHHWYDSFEHTLKDMNEPGAIIQAAFTPAKTGVSVRCLHGIWHLPRYHNCGRRSPVSPEISWGNQRKESAQRGTRC